MDLASDRTRLLERDAEWAVAASEGRDVERILSYWTDDAVVMPPGLPQGVGKAALRQYVEIECGACCLAANRGTPLKEKTEGGKRSIIQVKIPNTKRAPVLPGPYH